MPQSKPKPKRRRLTKAQSLVDDEAEEVRDNGPPVQNVVASFDSPQRPLNLSAFASRPWNVLGSPGSKFDATMTVVNNRGIVKITLANGTGSTFSEPVNKVMRAAQSANGS